MTDAPPDIKRRARPLYQLGVDEATFVLVAETELPPARARKIVESILRAYNVIALDAEGSRMDYRLSDVTKRLAAMMEGAKILLPSMALQDIRARTNTVRKLTGESDRRWRLETQHDGKIVVTRLRPGEPLRDQSPEPKAVELSKMTVGEEKVGTAIKSVRGKGQVCSSTKTMARRLMGVPYAQWTFATVREGVRVKRTR